VKLSHVVLLMLAALLLAAPASADKRVALVIGDSNYANAGTLKNPANDARDIATRLGSLGFKVILGIDQTANQFTDRMAEFAAAADHADVALFYFAGHGLQFQNTNFLVPVDARIDNQFQVRQQTIPLDSVIQLMEARAEKSLVFLDACRDNPFAERLKSSNRSISRGLARVDMRAPETLIAYAAAPGTVAADGTGRNSPFAAAMLKYMSEPGVEIEVMLKRVTASVLEATHDQQRPERLSRLTSEFYFDPLPRGKPAPVVNPAPIVQPAPQANRLALAAQIWEDVKTSSSPQVLNSFISTFPDTVFAALARERLAALEKPSYPATCAAVRDAAPGEARDGEATLFVGGDAQKPYKVWCAGMASGKPLEYLILGPGAEHGNFSTVVHGGAYEGAGGKDMIARFSRVRIDPKRLAILPGDLSFAQVDGKIDQTCCSNGGVPTGTRRPIYAAYGVALDCDGRSAQYREATAGIDLSETPFRLAADMKWQAPGFYPRATPPARWNITSNGRRASMVARSGYCASIEPVGGIIKLDYVGH